MPALPNTGIMRSISERSRSNACVLMPTISLCDTRCCGTAVASEHSRGDTVRYIYWVKAGSLLALWLCHQRDLRDVSDACINTRGSFIFLGATQESPGCSRASTADA